MIIPYKYITISVLVCVMSFTCLYLLWLPSSLISSADVKGVEITLLDENHVTLYNGRNTSVLYQIVSTDNTRKEIEIPKFSKKVSVLSNECYLVLDESIHRIVKNNKDITFGMMSGIGTTVLAILAGLITRFFECFDKFWNVFNMKQESLISERNNYIKIVKTLEDLKKGIPPPQTEEFDRVNPTSYYIDQQKSSMKELKLMIASFRKFIYDSLGHTHGNCLLSRTALSFTFLISEQTVFTKGAMTRGRLVFLTIMHPFNKKYH